MDAGGIAELKHFVERCQSDPSILHNPSLAFFKIYLQSLGARIPLIPKQERADDEFSDSKEHIYAKQPNFKKEVKFEDDIVKSDIEMDETGVVKPDNDPPQKMGDSSKEVTEENQKAAQYLKSKAMDASSEGKLDEGIDHLTKAITLNPRSAILYTTRAGMFLKLGKTNAAILDADVALQINPDIAKGYKVRGTARAMLGLWEESRRDLCVAAKLDYDEEIGLMLKKVERNVRRIEEHHKKYECLHKEREIKQSQRETQGTQVKSEDAEAKAALNDGKVMGIHSVKELDTKLNAASTMSRLAILYFTATWCGPCRFISPIFTSLAGKYPAVVFLKVDLDEARDAAAAWKVGSVPTFFFVKNGKQVDKVVGADQTMLEKKITQHAGYP